jgi:hypothetical protein
VLRLAILALALLQLAAAPADRCKVRVPKHERHVRDADKALLYDRLGITDRSCCVVDHVIPLELGGRNDLENLQVQDRKSAKEKDRVENFLAREVCLGAISLEEAQRQVQRWRKVRLP